MLCLIPLDLRYIDLSDPPNEKMVFNDLIPRMPPNSCCPWFMGVGYCLVLFFSAIAIGVSDAAAAAEMASLTAANILILSLFWSPRAFGQAAPPPMVVKFTVWLFSTSIMAVLTWCLTSEASSQLLSKASWVLAAVTSLGTFYFMFFSAWEPNHRSIRPLNACFRFCLVFVLFNSLLVIYRSSYDANTVITDWIYSVIFEFTSFLTSILLFWCITVMVIAARNSAIREWVKIGVWAFATMLAVMVVSKAAEVFPLPVKYVAWAMVVASSSSSFYSFFLQLHGSTEEEVHDSIV